MSQNVLIVGSVAFDTVETPSGKVEKALGGAAVYSSVAASFFAPVRIVGVVGKDFPSEHIEFLEKKGIDTKGLQVTDGETFHWAGSYEGDMNIATTHATDLNVLATFDPELPEEYKDSDYVFLANIDPELQLKVLDQVKSPKLVACDTMNFWIDTKKDALTEVLKRVDVAFINDAEIRQFTGEISITKASEKLRKLGVGFTIVKKGEHGALMFCEEDTCFAAASYPFGNVVDPTGAGDSFAGGFMGYVAKSQDTSEPNLRRAVIYGSTMASHNIEGFSLSVFDKLTEKEVQDRFNAFRKLVHFEEIS